jgi:hypothetical protein
VRMVRRIPGQPAFGEPEFPRWLNGDLTRACGKHLHYLCKGTISTIGIECPCLCKCHASLPSKSDTTPMPGVER